MEDKYTLIELNIEQKSINKGYRQLPPSFTATATVSNGCWLPNGCTPHPPRCTAPLCSSCYKITASHLGVGSWIGYGDARLFDAANLLAAEKKCSVTPTCIGLDCNDYGNFPTKCVLLTSKTNVYDSIIYYHTPFLQMWKAPCNDPNISCYDNCFTRLPQPLSIYFPRIGEAPTICIKRCHKEGKCCNRDDGWYCDANRCIGPVHGSWSAFGPFTSCSVICGGEIQTRSRLCNSPAAMNGGRPCIGTENESRACNLNPCPVPIRAPVNPSIINHPSVIHNERGSEEKYSGYYSDYYPDDYSDDYY